MDYKEDFKKWIENQDIGESTCKSYIRYLEWLSDKFYKNKKINEESIFKIGKIEIVKELKKFVNDNKDNKDSIIFNKEAKTLSKNGFYSASLQAYINFLDTTNLSNANENTPEENHESFIIKDFAEACKNADLVYDNKLIIRFVSSLLTKPFVILTGLSGSGKTKLAQAFVQWISKDKRQYKIVPVGADWTNREPLLGYPNGLEDDKYVMPDSGVLDLILEASEEGNSETPYFLILDEMNLSHVERYFADFLSIMESDDNIRLYSGSERKNGENRVDKEVGWPKNLFVIGTVNIDETTYMFSPKVLDRANVIEFRISPNEMEDFIKDSPKIEMKNLFEGDSKEKGGKGQAMAGSFLNSSKVKDISHEIDVRILNNFFKELQNVGAEFGYRSASGIQLLLTKLGQIGTLKDNEKIDIAIMQKLLPKLHGSRKKIITPLEILAGFCLERKGNSKPSEANKSKTKYQQYISENKNPNNWEIIYKISFNKIERMRKNAFENGFTSYAEA